MNKRIVVAEDFNVSRKIIVSVLTKAGHTVMEAEDGREAMELFDGREVDLLVTDFNMPHVNGAELIKHVRTKDEYSFMPILLLTTEVNEKKIGMALNENITAWIKKPFQTEDFLKVVTRALR